MPIDKLPLLIEPEDLAKVLGHNRLLIVDLSLPGFYAEGHVPGAVRLDYPSILHSHGATDCDIPSNKAISAALSKIGMTPDTHVVAYDRQHNPMACRLLWTLNEIAHPYFSLLNGGWDAWRDSGLPVDRKTNEPEPSRYRAERTGRALATKDYILDKLNNPEVVILDTRMHEEYTNNLIITDRGGMIPGAVHHDWLNSIDEDRSYRIRKTEDILPVITKLGVTPEKEVITYCQSHLRSAHTYFILKLMGYPRVLGYAAGYSEWGNDPATPIENEQEAA